MAIDNDEEQSCVELAWQFRLVRDFKLVNARQRNVVVKRFQRLWPDLYQWNRPAWRAGVLDELYWERRERWRRQRRARAKAKAHRRSGAPRRIGRARRRK